MRVASVREYVRAIGLYGFFFNDTATTEIYTLSLHDALPISGRCRLPCRARRDARVPQALREALARRACAPTARARRAAGRSEEHTSELQSLTNLVCRLLLEKKNHRCRPLPLA